MGPFCILMCAFWDPKWPTTDQILIFWPKKVRMGPCIATEGQIGVHLSVLITHQSMGPCWIPICTFWDQKYPLEGKQLFLGPFVSKVNQIALFYHNFLSNKVLTL